MPLQTIHYSFYATGTEGVTHYKVYAKNGSNFAGTGIPDNQYLINVLGITNNNLSYEPKTTGDYFFRFYSYNTDTRTTSTNFATGYVTVTGQQTASDYSVSTLRVARGGTNNASASLASGKINRLEPMFSWQVGNQDPEMLKDSTEFRITTRPVSTSSTPDSTIYYELTGYRVDISDPRFLYSYKQNIASSGGPYRNYDIVVEAHNRDGSTSAGNTINGPLSATETWSNAAGYDKLTIYNEKPTGLWLTTGNLTSNGYQTRQWIDGNKNLNIEVISGQIPEDFVGARVFYSVDSFQNSGYYTTTSSTGYFISSGIGQSGVEYSNILFEDYPNFRKGYSISVPTNIENTGFASISFFDTYELESYGAIERIPVNEISPVVPVYSTGSYHYLSTFNTLRLHNTGDAADTFDIQYRSPIGGTGYHIVYGKDRNNLDCIISTFS